ncbi:hypothetical protein PHYBOEH_007688, partial [Phytophthora boehmeriae]
MAEVASGVAKVAAAATGVAVVSEITDLLVSLAKLVAELRGSREMCDDLVKNVEKLLPHLTRMIDEGKISATAALTDYKALLIQIRDFLNDHVQKGLVPRLTRHWKVKDNIKTYYAQRDQIVERMGLEFQEEAADRHAHVSNRIEEIMRRERRIDEQAAKEFKATRQLIVDSFNTFRGDVSTDITTTLGSEAVTTLTDLKYEIKYNQERTTNELSVLEQTLLETIQLTKIEPPKLSAWYISRADIRFESSPFAAGATRSLHFGKLSSGAKVVVKVSNAAQDDTENRELFKQEVEKWYPLRNPHVLPLYGACHITTPQLFVLGFAEKGNFNEFLPKNDHLFWKVFLDAARGLAYLHSRRPPLVHANLKCSNLLVLADGTGVVSDFLFAFARENSNLSLNTQAPSTRWKAPECLQFGTSGNARVESDVYSLGMCLIEGLTGKPPFDGLNERGAYAKIQAGELPSRPDGKINDDSWTLIKAMCAPEFQDRVKLRE